jgi:hypothetical protein
MFANPELAVQLAREHQRQLRADASQQRHRPRRPEPGIPDTAATILHGLTAALTRAGVAAAAALGASWPARPHLVGEPAVPPARHTTATDRTMSPSP